MGAIPGTRLALVATLALLAVGLLGGAAEASTTGDCNETGRAICIAIQDQDDVTHSTTAIKRYTEYRVVVSNGGGPTLTNGSVMIALKDVLRTTVGEVTTETEVAPTGQFVAGPAGCTPSGASTSFTCQLGNLSGGSPAPELKFFARTSTNTAHAAMRLVVTATFNERGSDSEGPASNPDTFTWKATTELEPQPDFSQSIVFFDPALTAEGSTVLVTAAVGVAGANGQSSVFRVPVQSALTGLATIQEFDATDTGYFCPVAACFGQSVEVTAPAGVFTTSNLANLVTTIDLALLPKGVTENSLVVHHDGVSFTTKCSGAMFSTPSASQTLPCRRVDINRRTGTVTIDAWDTHQGDWGFS